MPTSFGSIGKIHNPISQDITFNCYIGKSEAKIHVVSLPKTGATPDKIVLLLDRKVLEINNQSVFYQIHGYTAKFGMALPQQVRLYDQETGQVIKEVVSSASGEFMFENLHPAKKYTLTTRDGDGILESDVIDSINAKVV